MKISCPKYWHHSFVCEYYDYGVERSCTEKDNRCEICCGLCYPFSCLADLICLIPMCFECYKVPEANIDDDYSRCYKYAPRVPYTFTAQSCDYCCIGCDKAGIGSKHHDPSQNSCNDIALCCFPCSLLLDIVCSIPLIFGCLTLEKIN
jgi:hypothetical protein